MNTQAYIEGLKQQSELNRLYAEKNQEAHIQEKYNITPAPQVEETAEEMMRDTTKQRQEALKNASTLPITREVAAEFVSNLHPEDLIFFNQSFSDFSEKVKKFKNVDANFLAVVFDRYMKAFAKNKGTVVPLELSDIQPNKKADIAKQYQEELEKRTQERIDRIVPGESNRRYQEALGETEMSLRGINRSLDRNFRERAQIQARKVEEALKKRLAIETLAQEIQNERDPDNRRWLLRRADREQERIDKRYRKAMRKLELEEQKLDTERHIDEGYKNEWMEDLAFARNNAEVPYPGAPFENMDLGEATGADDERFYRAGYGIKDKVIPSLKGMKRHKKEEPHAIFGKHFIHLPSLHQGFLNVKFRSRKNIPKLGRIPISDELRDVLLKALEVGSFDIKASKRLKENEIRLLIRVCENSSVEHPFSLESDDREVERFNVLRGEVEAGNDNPQIVKELKQLLLKFMAQGRIKRRDAIQMLYQLACV